MTNAVRGADLIARVLDQSGHRTVFTLSGNHIMPVFDAVLGSAIRLIHTRHETAAVHMADAFARLTGEVGIALVTGGQGHTNAVAALTTAQCAETPLVLLSGHAAIMELGCGAFQELAQVELARPVTKASWMVPSADRLGHDLAEAIRIARSGRPGPVHLSLPVDLLEAKLDDRSAIWPASEAMEPRSLLLGPGAAAAILVAMSAARRPLILCGPVLCTPHGRRLQADLQAALGIPVVGMESPRGINDPCLGAFAEMLRQADLIVLLGKPNDFTLRFCEPPHVQASATFIVIDPEAAMLERAAREHGGRIEVAALADTGSAAHSLIAASAIVEKPDGDWLAEVGAAIAYRPQQWDGHRGGQVEAGDQSALPPEAAGAAASARTALHPLDLCRAIQPIMARNPEAVFVCDGGEVGQWAQAGIAAKRRIINGVAGSIGSAVPFAIAARVVEPRAPIIAVSGDGAFGFHMAEFDTAVRCGLPFVVVVGNDARWNAEHQIQLRDYGPARAHSCSLLPTRYDEIARVLGGHGELVTAADQVAPALKRAIASGKPACVNVLIEGHSAPVVRRG